MSGKPIDMVGQRFGRWTVKSRAANIGTRAVWHCICDCGAEADVRGDALRRGKSLSCGCLAMEHSIAAHKCHNDYIPHGDYVEIHTNQGHIILLDAEDVHKVNNVYWYVDDCGYARALLDGKHIRMHRLLLDIPFGMVVDHISGNTLDNRKSNLRLCTPHQNAFNSKLRKDNQSGYKGVCLYRSRRGTVRYVASIGYNGKRICLGTYDSLEQAASVRESAERELYGEYSREYGCKNNIN